MYCFLLFFTASVHAQIECISSKEEGELNLRIIDTFIGREAQIDGQVFEVEVEETSKMVTFYNLEKILRLDIDLTQMEKMIPPVYYGRLYSMGKKSKVRCQFLFDS